MRRLLATITALMAFSLIALCQQQDTLQHRLFPGTPQRQRETKDDLRARIDSLSRIIKTLEGELDVRDSLHNKMAERVEDAERRASMGGRPEVTVEETDSLIHVYYVNKQMSDFKDMQELSSFMNDSVRFTTNVPDSVLIERLKAMNSYIMLPFNPTVKNYMVLYSEKNTAKMKRLLSRSSFYFPIFEEALLRYDMPVELKYMAIIESALNPTARSRAGAMGMWQFMYNTGKQYGLRINSFVDERLDVDKAADAAARYMLDAYKIFGDWALAISSYNCGIGNVNKAIHRSGRHDFWSIYPYLPRETRGYMPAFVGAMYGMTYYKEYGIVPDPPMLPAQVDTFHISRTLHFQQINDLVGVPMEELRELNPQYIRDIIPGNENDTYVLKLPYNYSNTFIDVQDTIYVHRADSLTSPAILKNIEQGMSSGEGGEAIRYKVKSGDYLGKIASRYHVSVNQIKKWNHLSSNNLRIGQVLTIYRGGVMPAPKPAPPAPAPVLKPEHVPSPIEGDVEKAAADTTVSAAVGQEIPAPQDSVQNVPAADSISASAPADSTSVETDPDSASVASPTESAKSAEAASETETSDKEAEYETYIVKKGDTLFGISKKFPGVTITEIQELNGITGSNIRIGSTLKIPKHQ